MQVVKVCLWVLPLLTLLGCGPGGGKVDLTGHITLAGGDPLARCRVIFRCDTGDNFSAQTDEDGSYRAGSAAGDRGILPGEYSVSILENRGDSDHPTPAKIHLKYGNPNRSGLTVTVPAESNSYDIVLDPPERRARK